MKYLSICCIAKNEHPFVSEWVNYHLMIGVEHIYLFDNESQPPLFQVLKKHVDHGNMTILRIEGTERQIPAYQFCLKEFGKSSKWIAFIDMDEFIFPKSHEDVRMILTDYEEYGGLGVHWVEYGSSGHLSRPSQGQIDSYTLRFPFEYPKNMHIKSIIQPQKTASPCDPHHFIYKDFWHCVDENGLPLLESRGPFCNQTIQLNHYYYRSQQDFFQKLQRGRADRADEAGKRKIESFYHHLAKANIYDDSLSKFYKSLSENKGTYRNSTNLNTEPQATENALINMAMMQISKNQIDIAVETIKKAKIRFIDDYNINHLLFKLFKKKGDYNNALIFIKKMLSQNANVNLFLDLTKTMILSGDIDDASKVLAFVKRRYAKKVSADAGLKSRIDYLYGKLNQ